MRIQDRPKYAIVSVMCLAEYKAKREIRHYVTKIPDPDKCDPITSDPDWGLNSDKSKSVLITPRDQMLFEKYRKYHWGDRPVRIEARKGGI